MRIDTLLAAMLLLLLAPAIPPASAGGPSVQGGVDFYSGDGVMRSIQFTAAGDPRAAATADDQFSAEGTMVFVDPEAGPRIDPDDPADVAQSSSSGLSVTVNFDCLVVAGNRAVMSGPIIGATDDTSVGRTFVLVVEDNGTSRKARPGRVTWGVYANTARTWKPSDAERADDDGERLEWIATDAERDDDEGVPSSQSWSPVVDCTSFPPSAYSMIRLEPGAGSIQVRP